MDTLFPYTQLVRYRRQRGFHAVGLGRPGTVGTAHIDRRLRHLLQPTQRLAQADAATMQHFEHLQGADDAVAGGGPVQAQQMTRGFTAEVAAVLEQGLVDMAVADLGAKETDTRLAQRPDRKTGGQGKRW